MVIEKWHGGSGNGYTYHGCRCDKCKAANRKRQARGQRARATKIKLEPEALVHGSNNTYTNWGCRCDLCKAVHRTVQAFAYQERKKAAQ